MLLPNCEIGIAGTYTNTYKSAVDTPAGKVGVKVNVKSVKADVLVMALEVPASTLGVITNGINTVNAVFTPPPQSTERS